MRGHGLDAKFATGAQYAQRNFAAIGNNDFFQHQRDFSWAEGSSANDAH
jgi:hypothetical protein